MQSKLKMSGFYVIEARDARTGKLLQTWQLKNMLTSINQLTRTQMLLGTYTGPLDALAIKYFAFGTGTTPASYSDTQLENEQFRKQVTQISANSNSSVQSLVSLGTTEANFNITEIGVFCGPNASAVADSGTLLSRVIVNIEKNTNIVLNIVRTDITSI